MFMEIDLGTPIMNTYVRALKIKNVFNRYWPTTTVVNNSGNTEVVLDKLYIYHKGVYGDASHSEIYKLLGTSVSELSANKWKGVDKAWMYLDAKKVDTGTPELSNMDVANYINDNSEVDVEYEVRMVYTQEFSGNVSNKITDQQIVDLIEGGYNSLYDPALIETPVFSPNNQTKKATYAYDNSMITFNTKINPCTFISIMDTDDSVFSSTTKIISKEVVKVSKRDSYDYGSYNNEKDTYTIRAHISYKYTRVRDAVDTDPLVELVKNTAVKLKRTPFSFYKQVSELLHAYNPVLESDLVFGVTTANIDDTTTTEYFIRAEEFKKLKPAQVVNIITKSIDSDYTEVSCKGWQCYIAPLVLVMAIVLAIVSAGALAPAGAGAAVAAGTATAVQVVAFFGALSLTLTVATFAVMQISAVFARSGQYANAYSFRTSITILNKLAEVTGYVAIAASITAAWQTWKNQAMKEALAKELGKQASDVTTADMVAAMAQDGGVTPSFVDYVMAAYDIVKADVVTVFTNFSNAPGAAMNKINQWLNYGMQAYDKWIDPVKKPVGGEQQADKTPPTSVQDIAFKQVEFDDYAFLDMNAKMDQTPDTMTQKGLMRETLSRYYEA